MYKFNGKIYKSKKACYRAAAIHVVGVMVVIVGNLSVLWWLYATLYAAGFR